MKQYRSKKAGANIIRTYDMLLDEWNITKEERMIPTSYGPTHVIICGKEDGLPLLMFHGVGDDSALMWIYNAKELGEHFRLYAVDTIGGPGKSVMGEGYDKEFDDVTWIDEIVSYLNLDQLSLIGVSHGSYLVQLYTLKRQDKINKAICLAGSVPVGREGNHMKTMMKIFLPEALFPTKKNVRKLLAKLSGDHAEVFTENDTIMEHYQWLLKGFNNMAMVQHKIRTFSDPEIDEIRDKVVYLVGKEDPFQKLGGEKVLKDYQMNARFFDRAGHGLNHELSEKINRMIIDIMKDNISSTLDIT
jgi:pimeloyl-ACP methyl ester carboxylesterase